MKKKSELEYLLEEEKKGNKQALFNLGFIYLFGQKVEKDEKKAVAYFKKGANLGDGRCMQALAMCYKNGDGTNKDEQQMLYWLKRGEKINDDGCIYQLGLYQESMGNIDEAKALMVKIYKKNKDAKQWLKKHHFIKFFRVV